MEHLYTVQTKLIQDQTYYFVKKILSLPEFKELADVVVGYGMHTDFEKACKIAGIPESVCRKQLLLKLEENSKSQKPSKKHTIQISDMVNNWLAERGSEVLN